MQKLRIGFLGLGTVGQGAVEILRSHKHVIAQRAGCELVPVRALVRDPKKARHNATRSIQLTAEPADIVAADDIDVVVEVLGGIRPARDLISQTLRGGKSVITANKAVLAESAGRLFQDAQRGESDLYFEAAVAGGMPIIRTLRESFASDRVSKLQGILNGTSNYVLGQVEAGSSMDVAVSDAQRLGYAEANPTRDLDGRDARDKLAILLSIAFGLQLKPSQIDTSGIQKLTPMALADARALGCRVKLVASAVRRGTARAPVIDAWVGPALVPEAHPLYAVEGAFNAVATESHALGLSVMQGLGAGGLPTGNAVVADLIEAARDRAAGAVGRVRHPVRHDVALGEAKMGESAFFVQLAVRESPGVLSTVTGVLGERGISISSLKQEPESSPKPARARLSLVTYPTTLGAMREAFTGLLKRQEVRGKGVAMRVLTGEAGK